MTKKMQTLFGSLADHIGTLAAFKIWNAQMLREKFEETSEMVSIWSGQRLEIFLFSHCLVKSHYNWFIQKDTDGNGLTISNESAIPIYIESSLHSLKTSQRIAFIQPNESTTVFGMKDFSGMDRDLFQWC